MNSTERAQLREALEHDDADLEITTGDMDIYVDYDNGSDILNVGMGTLAKPWKTPKRAAQDIPARIAHTVNLHIAARVTPGAAYPAASMPRRLDPIYVHNGRLNIFGVGAPTRKAVRGGPHTVTGIASTDLSQIITVAGASGWVADEFCGYWVRVLTGGHVGNAYRVSGNTTTTITVEFGGNTDRVHNADTIELIAPSVKITHNTDLDIFYDTHSVNSDTADDLGLTRLVIANLWIDMSASTSPRGQLRIHGNAGVSEGPLMEFVRIDTLESGVILSDVAINYGWSFGDYIDDCLADIANMGGDNCGPGLALTSAGLRADQLVYCCGSHVWALAMAVTGKITSGIGCVVNLWCSASVFQGSGGGHVIAWLAGKDSSTPAALLDAGVWDLVLIDAAGACNYAIDTDCGVIVRVHGQCTCSATLCDKSALRIGAMCKVTSDHSLAGFLGKTTGQYAYICAMAALVKSDTWPAAAGYVTDAKGGEFLRVT